MLGSDQGTLLKTTLTKHEWKNAPMAGASEKGQ